MLTGVGISLVAFVVFYAVSLSSALLPYAPSAVSRIFMEYGVAIAIIAATGWFGFVHKWAAWGETSWSRMSRSLISKVARIKKLSMFIIVLPIFAYGIAYGTQRWLAYPTKWFAAKNVTITLKCSSNKMWGKAIRNKVMIEGVDMTSGEPVAFPWPSDESPLCPSLLQLSGRRWVFGTFVTSVSQGQN